jgi:hypothetical protein
MSAINRSRSSGERLARSPALRTDFLGSMTWSLRMRQSPSIVPKGTDQDVHLVEDDLGRLGRIWREVDSENTGFETVVSDLLDGQYKNPVRVISFNIAEGWLATCPPTLPASCGSAASGNFANCPRLWRTLSRVKPRALVDLAAKIRSRRNDHPQSCRNMPEGEGKMSAAYTRPRL